MSICLCVQRKPFGETVAVQRCTSHCAAVYVLLNATITPTMRSEWRLCAWGSRPPSASHPYFHCAGTAMPNRGPDFLPVCRHVFLEVSQELKLPGSRVAQHVEWAASRDGDIHSRFQGSQGRSFGADRRPSMSGSCDPPVFGNSGRLAREWCMLIWAATLRLLSFVHRPNYSSHPTFAVVRPTGEYT
jgi:hypothetical protein